MSEYQGPGDGAVHSSFFDPTSCGACGMTLSLFGFLGHEIYPVLGVLSMLLGMTASALGIYQFWQDRRKRKKENE